MLVLEYALRPACGLDHYVAWLCSWRIIICLQLPISFQIFLLGFCSVDSHWFICIIICPFVNDCSITADGDSALAFFGIRHNANRTPINLFEIAEVQKRLLIDILFRVALLRRVLILVLILEIFDLDLHGSDLQVIRAIAAADFEVLECAVELSLLSGRIVTFL